MSYLRNKPPKAPVVHFMGKWKYATMTSCGQHAFERAAVPAEPRGTQRANIIISNFPNEVTCGSCIRTREFKRAKERDVSPKHEATVGIPTQGSESINWAEEAHAIGQPRPTAEPLAGALLGHNDSFGAAQPTIHAMTKRGTPAPLCGDPMDHGYSTMDGSVINCQACLQHPEFIRRNDMFTEMMSPSLPIGERPPIAKVHDREQEDEYGSPRFEHDCEACTYLGFIKGWDMYYCDQGGSPNLSTVIARFSDEPEDYISGLASARDSEMLAPAVIRAFRKGLLTDDEMSWL